MLDREAIGAINGNVNDMWGWTDPQTCGGTEWALVGHSRGTSFVGLSDPEAPRLYAPTGTTKETKAGPVQEPGRLYGTSRASPLDARGASKHLA